MGRQSIYRKELTAREQEIFKLLVSGWSKQEICQKLCLSYATIQTHITNIYQKVGVDGCNALQKMVCNHYKEVFKEMGVKNV